MIRQVAGGQQPAAGFLERVVQPLRRAAGVLAEGVVGPSGAQRGEDGLPDRLTGRTQMAVEQPGRVREAGQRNASVGLLQPLLRRARTVRVQVGEDPLT
jgi:hypothetical protein